MYVSYLLYSFICQWTYRLLQCGHIGYFNVSELQWTLGCMCHGIMVSLGYMPNSGIAGSYGSFISTLLEISILFSIMAIPVYIPTNSWRWFPFLYILSGICCCRVFVFVFFFFFFLWLWHCEGDDSGWGGWMASLTQWTWVWANSRR